MRLKMWTYDYAREQAPTLDHLRAICRLSLDSGYNALGLYLEHRFAYPSAPWAHGTGALQPETVRTLEKEFPDLQLVPFINLLGHMEGFLYTEQGKKFAEEKFKGLQGCASNDEFVAFVNGLLTDVLEYFSSPLVHIGGDETSQLARCPTCQGRIKEYERAKGVDGKSVLYGRHFAPLAARVVQAGRIPCVWGDMFLEHPRALETMPKDTLIFDWQYFDSPLKTAKRLSKAHQVVLCPTLQTYNAAWLHLGQSEANVRAHATAAGKLENVAGFCLTTWECGLMGNYQTLFPAIRASAAIFDDPSAPGFLDAYQDSGTRRWAELMGARLQECGGSFAWSGIRSSLKCRLLLYSNPFLAWLYHGEELSGRIGENALAVCDQALQTAPDVDARGVTEFVRMAVQFVRYAEQARQAYAQGLPGVAVACLSPAMQIFDDLAKFATATRLNVGGSIVDEHRCRVAKEHVERVILRIKSYGDGSLGYLPAFEHITHPKFVPNDQGAWWLVNSWANE